MTGCTKLYRLYNFLYGFIYCTIALKQPNPPCPMLPCDDEDNLVMMMVTMMTKTVTMKM